MRNLLSTMRCGNPQEIAKSEWIEEMDLIRERTNEELVELQGENLIFFA